MSSISVTVLRGKIVEIKVFDVLFESRLIIHDSEEIISRLIFNQQTRCFLLCVHGVVCAWRRRDSPFDGL